jgi:hypothetical protein
MWLYRNCGRGSLKFQGTHFYILILHHFSSFLLFIYFFPTLLSASFCYPLYKRIKFQMNEYLTFSRCLWQHIFILQRTKFKTLNTKLLSTKNLKFFQYSIMCIPCATIITTVISSYKGIPKDWKKIHCKQVPLINRINFWVYKSRPSGL